MVTFLHRTTGNAMTNRRELRERIRGIIRESLSLQSDIPELERGIKGAVLNPIDRARSLYGLGKQPRSPRIAVPMTELIMMIATLANQPGAESKMRRLINRMAMSPEMKELNGDEEGSSVFDTAHTFLPKAKFEHH
jgi:hypothetical protein